MAILESERNPFDGRIVGLEGLATDRESFTVALTESINAWRGDGTKVVWLHLSVDRAELVPVAVAAGFVYHHADQTGVQLTLSLEPGAYVPPFATHYIGAGGVVINDHRELLVIQERHHTRRHYKLPGGALYPGEHLVDAVIREVAEETGIRTRFLSIVALRHWHGYRHGKSDIYFITRLEPLTSEITLDPTEIAECFWMPVDEYLVHPDTHQFNRRIVQAALDLERSTSDPQQTGHGRCLALQPEALPGYGTPATHELFFPRTASRSIP